MTIGMQLVITNDDILSHPELPWNYCCIEKRKNLNMSLYQYLVDEGGFTTVLINSLSRSESITIDDVISNPDIPWNYNYLSVNPNITWKIINIHPEIPWSLPDIAGNNMSCPVYCKYWKSKFNEIIREINY